LMIDTDKEKLDLFLSVSIIKKRHSLPYILVSNSILTFVTIKEKR